MRFPAENSAFVGYLAFRVKALMPLLQEHLDDNDGVILPHVLLFQIREWVETTFLADGMTDDVTEIIQACRLAVREGSNELRDLVSLSFVEDLPHPPAPGSELRRLVMG